MGLDPPTPALCRPTAVRAGTLPPSQGRAAARAPGPRPLIGRQKRTFGLWHGVGVSRYPSGPARRRRNEAHGESAYWSAVELLNQAFGDFASVGGDGNVATGVGAFVSGKSPTRPAAPGPRSARVRAALRQERRTGWLVTCSQISSAMPGRPRLSSWYSWLSVSRTASETRTHGGPRWLSDAEPSPPRHHAL